MKLAAPDVVSAVLLSFKTLLLLNVKGERQKHGKM
jgi:hypothetical protein